MILIKNYRKMMRKFSLFFMFFSHCVVYAAVLESKMPSVLENNPDQLISKNHNTHSPLLKPTKIETLQQFKGAYPKNLEIPLCDQCHSLEMAQNNRYLPLLQGQNREYLYLKILSFKENRKAHHPFPLNIQRLSENDVMDISLYYANQTSPFADIWASTLYQTYTQPNDIFSLVKRCQHCHGNDGKGMSSIPALSGQNVNYLSYRIREISNNDSKVHIYNETLINCDIPEINIRQSRRLAHLFGLLVNHQRVQKGESVYQKNCAKCHEQGLFDAPITGNTNDWFQRIASGTEALFKNLQVGRNRDFHFGSSPVSYQQRLDALHFMISEIAVSDR